PITITDPFFRLQGHSIGFFGFFKSLGSKMHFEAIRCIFKREDSLPSERIRPSFDVAEAQWHQECFC
ncbi:MAG: hypothetical protein J5949_09355, partial [Oscillospiraceae bacterium]|nr:hypothetical protein [Oscillospiraceae bacterium]